ncbi:unnamed protein product, partial [Iphiclides podalirius]
MSCGKTRMLYKKYTYYKYYSTKTYDRWICTLYPKCKSSLKIHENQEILLSNLDHKHMPTDLYKLSNGTFLKVSDRR